DGPRRVARLQGPGRAGPARRNSRLGRASAEDRRLVAPGETDGTGPVRESDPRSPRWCAAADAAGPAPTRPPRHGPRRPGRDRPESLAPGADAAGAGPTEQRHLRHRSARASGLAVPTGADPPAIARQSDQRSGEAGAADPFWGWVADLN